MIKLILSILMVTLSHTALIKPYNDSYLTYIYIPFQWEQEADAISYNLQVSTDEYFINTLVDIEESTTSYIEEQLIDWSQNYYWRIRPLYSDDDFGDWSEIFTFHTGEKQFPDIDAEIYNEDFIQEGLVAFGGFAPNLASAVIDKYGNEIWNSGEPGSFDFMINHINKFGNIYGLSVYNYPYNTGTKINYDIDLLWSTQGDLNSD